MPVSVPTPAQLKEVAAEMGLALTDADIDSFITLMKPTIEGYNVVDALRNNLPPVKYPRTPGHRPGQRCAVGPLGRLVSEYGTSCHGDGAHEGGGRCRRAFMLTTLELLAKDVADFFRPLRGEF